MTKRTKKVGITGKYGPRYGVKIRKQTVEASRHRIRPQRCPECQHDAVKRVSSGIWLCNHCKLKFAAAAYSIRTRSFRRTIRRSKVGEFIIEDDEEFIEGEPSEEPVPFDGPEKPQEELEVITVPDEFKEELAEEMGDLKKGSEEEPEEKPREKPKPLPRPRPVKVKPAEEEKPEEEEEPEEPEPEPEPPVETQEGK